MAASNCVPDRERAVKEVAQVYELIKIQQPLLLLHCSSLPPSVTTQLAQTLLGEALRALNVALSVMKQPPPPPPAAASAAGGGPVTPRRSIKAEPQPSPPSPASADSEEIATTARRAKKRSRSSVMAAEGKNSSSSSWVDFTVVPYEDGYEWRKYGEKKINGTSFTRSYFRCTYKDDTGCMATKHIQQKDNNDPPMFQVTYNNKHTCNNCPNKTTASHSSERVVNPLNGHAAMNIKQEPPVLLLPPLVEATDALPFDQTPPCQQQEPSFPISMQQFCGTSRECPGDIIPSTSSSCISGESCDEYYSARDMAQMAADEASVGDNPFEFSDFELYILCQSFETY